MWQIIKHPMIQSVLTGQLVLIRQWNFCCCCFWYLSPYVPHSTSEVMCIAINNVHIFQMACSYSWAVLRFPPGSPFCWYLFTDFSSSLPWMSILRCCSISMSEQNVLKPFKGQNQAWLYWMMWIMQCSVT